jgi:hypothetical protein
VFGGLRGSAAYILIGDDTSQASTTGGTYGNIDLGHVSIVTSLYAVKLNSPAAQRIRIDLAYGALGSPPSCIETTSGGATRIIEHMEITGVCITGSTKVLNHQSTAVTLTHVVLDGMVANFTTGAGYGVYMTGAVTAGTIDFLRCSFGFTSTGSSSAMFQNNSSGGVCTAVNILGGLMTQGNVTIGDNSNSSTVFTVGMGFQTTSRFFATLGAASATGTKTLNFKGCYLDNSGTIITINTIGLILQGDLTYNTGFTFLTRTQGTEVVHCLSPMLHVDLSQLSRATAGDMAFNSNASLTAATGSILVAPYISTGSGSSGSWVSMVNNADTY